jgi:hypothetical protein
MKLLQPRSSHFDRLVGVIADPARLAAVHADTTAPGEITSWLGRLKLLHGVPFQYLVADGQMLPPESMRFFQLDFNWIDSLVEGAYSIGQASSADLAHDALLAPRVKRAAWQQARAVRTAAPASSEPPDQATGFLLRSGVVSGWPGLEVTAYNAAGIELPNVLRMERLAPTVLLFLVEGVIDHVDLQEPAEGLHFGVDLSGAKAPRYVTVPGIAPAGTKPGDVISGVSVPVNYRGNRVLKVDALATAIKGALVSAKANLDPNTGEERSFTAAEFALELVEGVQAVRFYTQG